MASQFTYSIASDTANGTLASEKLHDTIAASNIIIALDGVSRSGDVLQVNFKGDLTGAEETTLDGIVAAHDGVPGPKDPQPVDIKQSVAPSPFASKYIGDKSLYTRVHGIQSAITVGTNNIDFTVPYAQAKFNALEIVNADVGDKVSLKILDSATGIISTIPFYELNQFGFDIYLPDGFYVRESQYDADLISGLVIRLEYTTAIAKTVKFNVILHELK